MKKLLAALIACALLSGSAEATITPDLALPGGGGITGSTWTLTQTGLMDAGISFDVTYTIQGSSALAITGGGIGVAAGADQGVNSGGEFLTFSAAISNISAGGVVSGSLVNADLNGTTGINSTQALGAIASTPSTTGTSVTINGTAPSFSVGRLRATFTAAAVPEPSSLAALGCLGLGMVVRRRRRK